MKKAFALVALTALSGCDRQGSVDDAVAVYRAHQPVFAQMASLLRQDTAPGRIWYRNSVDELAQRHMLYGPPGPHAHEIYAKELDLESDAEVQWILTGGDRTKPDHPLTSVEFGIFNLDPGGNSAGTIVFWQHAGGPAQMDFGPGGCKAIAPHWFACH